MASAGRMDEREYVEQQLTNLWAIVDKTKVEPLRGMTPAIAQKRIAQLMGSPRARSLQTLAEIRMFQAAKLIDEAEVEQAAQWALESLERQDSGGEGPYQVQYDLQDAMQAQVGIVRSENELQAALT